MNECEFVNVAREEIIVQRETKRPSVQRRIIVIWYTITKRVTETFEKMMERSENRPNRGGSLTITECS